MKRDLTVNRFRSARGRVLRAQIETHVQRLGRPLKVLDVGGRAEYWDNVGLGNIAHITLMNYDPAELERTVPDEKMFTKILGDARNLTEHADNSFDLVHSNSVIEHVGMWNDMAAMATEVMRVGQAGWIQTPAWEFPVEPHFRTLFMHWFGKPVQRAMFSLSFEKRLRNFPMALRRQTIDGVNLLSYREVRALFPERDIYIERLALLPKSYTVRWHPGE
jgi:ubiquinone/menaquinone biosynthesis C-methylase UbiE